jgi:hypothetical protein
MLLDESEPGVKEPLKTPDDIRLGIDGPTIAWTCAAATPRSARKSPPVRR